MWASGRSGRCHPPSHPRKGSSRNRAPRAQRGGSNIDADVYYRQAQRNGLAQIASLVVPAFPLPLPTPWYRKPIASRGARAYHVAVDIEPCPTNVELAEAYVMGRLTADQSTAFEDHYIVCAACAAVVQETALYVEYMKAAARQVRAGTPRSRSSARN